MMGKFSLRVGAGAIALAAFLGAARADVARFTADAGSTPLQVVPLDDPAIAALYARRLVLVRPDGHVAWRGDTPDRAPREIFAIVCGRAA